ncbi:uncharacterized protein LOC127880122 [Dreissena polymorpha]|uniref:uncharacterized protein LOC127880122 n=1 Tax=Dreissena polymorpha TaxID=45954 RepID=UPI00226515D0|nr:uncharacterized protein LOC127880122 [Dreissena polymorpha]XP_052283317.1 uncharacterized protein LOC127880122 [Dreissena polymorpha]
MPVLSIEDYKRNFVHVNKYGRSSSDGLPRQTLVVYKCEWDIECDRHFNKGQIPWSVIKNEEDCHAETYLLNSLREKLKTYHSFRYENFQNQQDELKKNLHVHTENDRSIKPLGHFFLNIYLSYSPCGDCADQLITFANEFHDQLDVQINISFSTFYEHTKPSNYVGLLRLRNPIIRGEDRICMSILNGADSWEKFFKEMEVKGTKTLSKWKEIATTSLRHEREKDDNRIFSMLDGPKDVPRKRCLKFFSDFDIHTPCYWSHKCFRCENIHEIPHLCDKWSHDGHEAST